MPWLSRHIPLIQEDWALKYREMRTAAFPFLHAIFYRWVQLWPEKCPELRNAPVVLSTGDLHIETIMIFKIQLMKLKKDMIGLSSCFYQAICLKKYLN
jgi:hypothetical protein